MHITILAVGSQGDVQPYVALGRGLQAAGHHVQIATHSNFREFVAAHGLGFAEVKGNPREWLDTERGLNWIESGVSLWEFYFGLKHFMAPILESLLPTSYTACQGSDVVLYSSLAISGPHIGEKLRRPHIPLMLQPVYPTGDFPSVLAASSRKTGKAYNYFTHLITDQILHQATRKTINRWRRESLGLPAVSPLGHMHQARKNRTPQLLGYSEHVLPRPRAWGDHVHVTGYWFLDGISGWSPPAELAQFLSAGSPPIYFGFGSMTIRHPEKLTTLVLRALELSGQRAILLGGWGNLGQGDLPGHVFKVGHVPHDWLFPRMAAVVHHGGAGTTAAALRAGIPAIVTPFFADQFFWGQRVESLGAGPKPLPFSTLTPERLAQAIESAVNNPAIKNQSNALGEKLRAEDGIQRAVDILQRTLTVRG